MTETQTLVDSNPAEGSLQASPWSRLWARCFDMQIYGFVLGYSAGAAFPDFFSSELFGGRRGELFAGLLFLPLSFLVDALVQSAFGVTLGKAIAGIRIEMIDHRRPKLGLVIRRNAIIYVRAFVLGLPLISLIGFNRAYRDLVATGRAYWDRRLLTEVTARERSAMRTTAVAIATLLVAGAIEILTR